MSYSMYIRGEGFDGEGWLSELKSTYIGEPASVRTPFSSLFYQIVDVEEDLDREEFWLHPKDGVRGVHVTRRGGEVELSVPTAASESDFILAGDLLRLGIKHGGNASTEEDESLQATDEEISAISDKLRKFSLAMMSGHAGEGGLSLPVGILQLPVSDAELAAGPEELEKSLVERMRRYSDAFVASRMQVKRPDGQIHTLSNYGHIPSLIHSEIEMIETHGDGGPLFPAPVPAPHFFEVLGDRVEKLGNYLYVPVIDFKSEPELVEALGRHAPPSTGQASKELTGDDWALLAKAPCVVFVMVAAADGKVDKKELAMFGGLLRKHADVPLPVFSKVLKIALANLEHMISELVNCGIPPVVQLAQVRGLLDSGKMRPEEAADVAKGLYALGRAIASASGGFLGFGSKISKQEAEVLDVIEKIMLK